MDLLCAICRETFDDPVLARDGYAYCRHCIVRWTERQMEWRSPRTNERLEGLGVLRGDVERCCLAREARLAELRERCRDGDLAEALALGATTCHQGRTLLPSADCVELLTRALAAEAYGWESDTYLLLELAHRGGVLDALPASHFAEICRRDRTAVHIPLLGKEVLVALAQEAARRLRAGAQALEALLSVKAHLVWRAGFSDAVEVPAYRATHDCMAGVYYRDWAQSSADHILFSKRSSTGLGVRLWVPLQRQRSRGSAEPPVVTRLETSDVEPLRAFYASEVDLLVEPADDAALDEFGAALVDLGRRSRGAMPFPDSRGGDTDDEDMRAAVPEPLAILQRRPAFLPRGFIYHAHCVDEGHVGELLRALNPVNESLLAYYQEEEPPTKRSRGGASR